MCFLFTDSYSIPDFLSPLTDNSLFFQEVIILFLLRKYPLYISFVSFYCNCWHVYPFPYTNLWASCKLWLASSSLCSAGSQPIWHGRICSQLSIERKSLGLTWFLSILRGKKLNAETLKEKHCKVTVTESRRKGWQHMVSIFWIAALCCMVGVKHLAVI